MYSAIDISKFLKTSALDLNNLEAIVRYLSIDSRTIDIPEETLFFSLPGHIHDGHEFVLDVIQLGVKNIVVSKKINSLSQDLNIFVVDNVLDALQKLAQEHRKSFPELKTLAITGSNGKTIIKEWLYQMIHDRKVVKSPKSYNSQTGVPLSLWQIDNNDELGLFEAGISKPGEMTKLEAMIQPTIGLFTTLGDAHAEGFKSIDEKLNEKLVLFKTCQDIIFCEDNKKVAKTIREKYPDKNLLSWGKSRHATLFYIEKILTQQFRTSIEIKYNSKTVFLEIPFTDSASVENALQCVAVMCVLKMPFEIIQKEVLKIRNIPMRLEMINGLNNNILVNDTYNADLQSFQVALDFLNQQAGNKEKVLIISDFMQTGLTSTELNNKIAELVNNNSIKGIIGIGSYISNLINDIKPDISFFSYPSTEAFLGDIIHHNFQNKAILIKGARIFRMERIIDRLSVKVHTASLETDLQALGKNLSVFSEHIGKNTGIIAVIKASAYGSGSEELARFLEFKKIDCLAVAYTDEGVELRKSGIQMPIIILNPDDNGVNDMLKYRLEPEVYSLSQLKTFTDHIDTGNDPFNIHIKLDTGMHRMGFEEDGLKDLTDFLNHHTDKIKVRTIFSHLSSSEDPNDDEYTHYQVSRFLKNYNFIIDKIGYSPQKHILNSSGIIRFPEYHFDFVRLGLGLYGIDSTGIFQPQLEKVHTFKASVIQVKNISPTDSVGYNRKGHPQTQGKIAIVNVGYADGLMRNAGNGRYQLSIHGKDYPIIGNICMDLTILELGKDSQIAVGDDVIIFGKDKPVEKLAEVCDTIPYEILTRISTRVKRVYINS